MASAKKGIKIDNQTGTPYELMDEDRVDTVFAIVSIVYLLLMMAFFLWQIFDIWIGTYSLAYLLGYPLRPITLSASFRLVVFAFMGGALGGIVNGIRSFLGWHAERYAFKARFTWNYITAPWLGSALALFTYALIRSGIAIFGGSGSPGAAGLSEILATFSVGVLSGYGSKAVFVWLDEQVSSFFKVPPPKVLVPKLVDLSQEDAEKALKDANLKLGNVIEAEPADPTQEGKVTVQDPEPGVSVEKNSSVNLTIGRKAAPVTPPPVEPVVTNPPVG